MHQLPHRFVVLLSSRKGQNWTDDECGGNPRVMQEMRIQKSERKITEGIRACFCTLTSTAPFLSRGCGGGWWRRRSGVRNTLVHQILQLFAGLEKRNFLGGHFNFLAGLGIPSHPRFALARAEAAKAANLNLVARAQ